MSYDIEMRCACCGQRVPVAPFTEGGTYPLGGTDEAHLDVTYNYGRYYVKHLALGSIRGLRAIYGHSGAESLPVLEAALDAILADEVQENEERAAWYPAGTVRDEPFADSNYWAPTRHNAAAPLARLIGWCKQHPTAIFQGD